MATNEKPIVRVEGLSQEYGQRVAGELAPVVELVKAMLPPGTHFALIVESTVVGSDRTAVIGLCTDMDRMAPLAATWSVAVLRPAALPQFPTPAPSAPGGGLTS